MSSYIEKSRTIIILTSRFETFEIFILTENELFPINCVPSNQKILNFMSPGGIYYKNRV